MRVSKYRGKTISEATAKVKNDLGADAMIVSTEKLSEADGSDRFEITAMAAKNYISDGRMGSVSEVKSELMSIKEMIYLLDHSGGLLEKLMMAPAVLNLYVKLIKNGIKDCYVKLFLERAGVFNGNCPDAMNHARKQTIQEIVNVIRTKDPFKVKGDKQTIAAFIGTTGVGKTTTIAKLAAQLMLKSRKKVGLISIDTYRIGAMEQLKTYANILGIPCFQAFNKKDLLFALRRMAEKDVVLIDTAGQSQYDLARIEELKKMIPDDLAMNTHLLLSVATTEYEMEKTAVNFSPLNYQSYIFTKADEAEKFGSVINQIMKLNLPVSYITTGQNVPEDIERADKKKILNLILNKDQAVLEKYDGSGDTVEKNC
ncbi:MAG: hypothetical protein KKH68_11140 [Proteobacteria bacterium]|nr:hypothetical protein [Pseudomonadota bacterium]